MIYKINKGKHRAWPPAPGLFWNKKTLQRVVSFDISAKYDLPGTEDDEDVNKLFGIGYLPGHHTDSARFGWVYNNASNKIDVYAYCYVNGERKIKFICAINLFKRVLMVLDVLSDCYCFSVVDPKWTNLVLGSIDVKKDHDKKIGYRLGCYFGGNQTAPHKITIEIKRK